MVTTINAQRLALGRELKRRREAAKLASAAVEQALGWHAGKNARVERGFRVPVSAEIDRLLELYRVAPAERDSLRRLALAARKRETLSRLADFANTYLALERETSMIRYWDDVLVPSLLQTEAYALAVLTHAGVQGAEQRAPDRLARRRLLEGDDAPTVRVLLGEAVTMQEVGGLVVLRDQMRHLVELTRKSNVAVRIIPFAAGAHRGLGVGFTHLQLRAPVSGEARVYIEGFTDATYINDQDEVAEYAVAFDRLWSSVAADDAESVTILGRRIDSIGGSDGPHTVA